MAFCRKISANSSRPTVDIQTETSSGVQEATDFVSHFESSKWIDSRSISGLSARTWVQMIPTSAKLSNHWWAPSNSVESPTRKMAIVLSLDPVANRIPSLEKAQHVTYLKIISLMAYSLISKSHHKPFVMINAGELFTFDLKKLYKNLKYGIVI